MGSPGPTPAVTSGSDTRAHAPPGPTSFHRSARSPSCVADAKSLLPHAQLAFARGGGDFPAAARRHRSIRLFGRRTGRAAVGRGCAGRWALVSTLRGAAWERTQRRGGAQGRAGAATSTCCVVGTRFATPEARAVGRECVAGSGARAEEGPTGSVAACACDGLLANELHTPPTHREETHEHPTPQQRPLSPARSFHTVVSASHPAIARLHRRPHPRVRWD